MLESNVVQTHTYVLSPRQKSGPSNVPAGHRRALCGGYAALMQPLYREAFIGALRNPHEPAYVFTLGPHPRWSKAPSQQEPLRHDGRGAMSAAEQEQEQEQAGVENECRICRDVGTPDAPLWMPCRCNGTNGAVHLECLDRWLKVTHQSIMAPCSVLSHTHNFNITCSPSW